jgi:hypothetical protein
MKFPKSKRIWIEKFYNKHKLNLELLGILLAIIFIFSLCYVTYITYAIHGRNIKNSLDVLRTSQDFPAVQVRFNENYITISNITEDTLLNEHTIEPLHVPRRFYTHCIRGSIERISGKPKVLRESEAI